MNLGTETEKLEFKKSASELKEGIISLSSMLNKHGYGVLYFGVKDDGKIVGQQIGKLTLRDISQQIANNLKPQCIPNISIEYIEGVEIIKIVISGTDKPYSAYGKYYMRSADEDRELNPNQLKSLMLKYSESSISDTECHNQNLSFNQIRSLFLDKGLTLSNESYKSNLNLLTKDNKYNILADLLSDDNNYSIKVARFKGTDKTELIERNEYGYKCLLLAMDQVLTYIEALNTKSVQITSHKREETPLFDILCFREAWINACLHNKWIKGTPPVVYFFNDRIEIVSTGGLPADYSEEDFFMGISNPVNRDLQKIMGQLNFVEQTGHGVPLIVNRYGRQAFNITKNFIIVTIPFTRNFINTPITTNYQNISKSSQMVLSAIINDPYITTFELMEKMNLSESRIYKIMGELKKENKITRIGSKRKGYWQIN